MFINLTIKCALHANDCTSYTSHNNSKERKIAGIDTVKDRDKDCKDCEEGSSNATRSDVLLSSTGKSDAIDNKGRGCLAGNRCN